MGEKKKKGSISYAKWGYIFIAPFFIIFAVFQLIPLASTIYYSWNTAKMMKNGAMKM